MAVVGKLVKQGKVCRDQIAFGREVAAAQVFVEEARCFVDLQGEDEGLGHVRLL